MVDEGQPIQVITDELIGRGFTHTDGSKITVASVHRKIYKIRQQLVAIPNAENSVEAFIREKIRSGKATYRVGLAALYHSYRKFTIKTNRPLLSRQRLTQAVLAKYEWAHYQQDRAVKGIRIEGEQIHSDAIESDRRKQHGASDHELLVQFYEANRGKELMMGDLYHIYLEFAQQNGQSAHISKSKLGRFLKSNGAEYLRVQKGSKYYLQ